jgi:hypothetical protein
MKPGDHEMNRFSLRIIDAALEAERMVAELNEVFAAFDDI